MHDTLSQCRSIYGDMKVLELADVNGMYCGKMLAAMGAQVIKLEKPEGDGSRRMGPFAGGEEELEKSLSFAYYNTGKRDITLDITSEKGREIFLKLIAQSDVLLETCRPGELDALGIGYETLKAVNPALIHASITPFGLTGRHAAWKADSDLIVDAMGGCMAEVGYVGKAPLHIGYDVMASACGMYALFAIQAAYHERLETGVGVHIDISQQECVAKWRSQALGFAQATEADQVRKIEGKGVRQGLVNCKDGFCFVMIAAKWKELMGWFSDKGLDVSVFDDPKYLPHTYEVLTRWDQVLLDYFNELGKFYTKSEFMIEGQRRRIPVAVVDVPETLLDNEQYNARSFYVDVDHPVIGKYKYPGAPFIMSESPLCANKAAPLLGQDTDAILSALDCDVSQLKREHVV